jgi:hypothetical protein
LKEYVSSGHSRLRTDPAARSPAFTRIAKGASSWRVEQVLADPDDHNDWIAVFEARFGGDDTLQLLFQGLGPIG